MAREHKNLLLLGLALAGLAACDSRSGQLGAGSRTAGVCTPFAATMASNGGPGAIAPALDSDPSAALDDCLHRWGYALAASPDPADSVAQATVAACVSGLTRWNQMGAASASAGGPDLTDQAPSLVTGQSTNGIAEHYAFAQSRSLFYVVQARAGKCAPPPMTAAPAGPAGVARP